MFKIIQKYQDNIINLSDMKPLQIGIIVEGEHKNELVMRSASSIQFEVINLTRVGVDYCWINNNCPIPVKLLNKGEQITLEVI